MGTFVTTEHEGAVALVTIDNPPHERALGGAPRRSSRQRSTGSTATTGTRAIVLRGAGERAFVAGADIKEFPALREAGGARAARPAGCTRSGTGWTLRARRSSRRSRATASAAGSSSRCAATSASAPTTRKLGQPEIKLGLIPGGGGTQRLPRLVGLGRANLLNLGGDFIDAETAYEWGLVERVVPATS